MKKTKKTKQVEIAPPKAGASSGGWHSISTMLRCPKEYQYSIIRGITKPSTLLPDPLAVGWLFHAGRSHWFQSNFVTGAEYWNKLKTYVETAADTHNPPIRSEAINRTLSYLEQYIAYWCMRAKPQPVVVEQEIGPAPLQPHDPFYLHRTFRPDDVSIYPEANFKLCIGECKTTSVSVEDCVNEYTLHGQPLMQYLVWKLAPNGAAKHGEVDHVLLDVVVKGYGKDKCKFGRQAIRFTPSSLAWYTQSMRSYLQAAGMIEVDTVVPRNITSCTRLSGRARVPCPYRDLCQFGERVSNQYVTRNGLSLNNPKVRALRLWE